MPRPRLISHISPAEDPTRRTLSHSAFDSLGHKDVARTLPGFSSVALQGVVKRTNGGTAIQTSHIRIQTVRRRKRQRLPSNVLIVTEVNSRYPGFMAGDDFRLILARTDPSVVNSAFSLRPLG